MPRCISFLPFVLVAVGCGHSSQFTWKIDDPVVMKSVLAEHVPHGTPVADARRFMESEGFDCRECSNGSFIERTWFGDREPRYDGIDFTDCDRVQNLGIYKGSFGGLLMSRNWRVALVNDGNAVTDILVSHYIDGP